MDAEMDGTYLFNIGVALIAAISPLLTFTALFQQKEWRLDRLREHLRQYGRVNQLFGKVKLYLIIPFIILQTTGFTLALSNATTEAEALYALIPFTLAGLLWTVIFGLLNVIQIVTRKQRMPVWTMKAVIITALSATLFVASMIFGLNEFGGFWFCIVPVLALFQQLFVLAAWLIFKPVDYMMKMRTMNRAAALRSELKDATVIGIAGSVGKTTTKELIAHLLQDLKPLTTPAHVNTEMGVAQWLIQKLRATSPEKKAQLEARGSRLFIVEMGAYRAGEIALLSRIAQPTIGVMTALGSDHLALFGSEEAIVEANGELIAALPKNGHAFLYGDNDGCKALVKQSPCPATLTGLKDLKPTDIKEMKDGIEFRIQNVEFRIQMHGLHNIHNILLAIGVARHVGVKNERIVELLKTFNAPSHTFNVRMEAGVTLLDDTYNISPLSMRAALDWAKNRKAPRTLLTSGLQETGDAETRFLEELGAHAKGTVERVVFTHAHGADAFGKAFGKKVEILNSNTTPVATGSTLLAVGRMPLSTIQRLLPKN